MSAAVSVKRARTKSESVTSDETVRELKRQLKEKDALLALNQKQIDLLHKEIEKNKKLYHDLLATQTSYSASRYGSAGVGSVTLNNPTPEQLQDARQRQLAALHAIQNGTFVQPRVSINFSEHGAAGAFSMTYNAARPSPTTATLPRLTE